MNLQAEKEFFYQIAVMVRNLVQGYAGQVSVTDYKTTAGDYATEVDVAVENMIVDKIRELFPADLILAEEGFKDTQITNDRIWIIDPICGTTNLGRGLKSFCTNIALAQHGRIIAACVIDHSQPDFFWSIGGGQVFINDTLSVRRAADERFGVAVDVDIASLYAVEPSVKKRHSEAVYKLTLQPGYVVQSPNSSLGFAYTAVGKIDGFLNVFSYPWDISAAAFLIQQSGGVVTDLNGDDWSLKSVGAIGAANSAVHQKILAAYTQG